MKGSIKFQLANEWVRFIIRNGRNEGPTVNEPVALGSEKGKFERADLSPDRKAGKESKKRKTEVTEFAQSIVNNAYKIGELEKQSTTFYFRVDSLSRRA